MSESTTVWCAGGEEWEETAHRKAESVRFNALPSSMAPVGQYQRDAGKISGLEASRVLEKQSRRNIRCPFSPERGRAGSTRTEAYKTPRCSVPSARHNSAPNPPPSVAPAHQLTHSHVQQHAARRARFAEAAWHDRGGLERGRGRCRARCGRRRRRQEAQTAYERQLRVVQAAQGQSCVTYLLLLSLLDT